MRWSVTFALLASSFTSSQATAHAFPEGQKLPIETLASMRGGFDLPGGLMVSLGVTTTTAINGQEVLRTVFDVHQDTPTIQAFADRGMGLESVPFDDAMKGIQTALGTLTVRSSAQGSRVDLSGRDISVSNLLGNALGSVVANSANDRTIDVMTTVNIQVSGVDAGALGGAFPLVNAVAADAATRLIR
jgi:hypothetical protein